MDLTTIFAAIAGGGIGIAAEMIGRHGANRQAQTQRTQAIEDARVSHERQVEIEIAKERRADEKAAVYRIVNIIRDNPIPLLNCTSCTSCTSLELDDHAVAERVHAIMYILYSEQLGISDKNLRERLHLAEGILDLALAPNITLGPGIREVVFIVRNSLYIWLGAWLRGEPLPTPSPAWERLTEGLVEAEAVWKKRLKDTGHSTDPSLT